MSGTVENSEKSRKQRWPWLFCARCRVELTVDEEGPLCERCERGVEDPRLRFRRERRWRRPL
jgi:hypothetical protein